MTGSYAGAVLVFAAVYTGLSWIYWYVEVRPGGKKSFLDILLWNNLNVILSRGFTDYIPTGWAGRALLMVFILFSMLFMSTIIGYVSSRINAYNSSPARRIKKVQSLSGHVIIFGWKNDIRTLISDILRKSGGKLTPADIVIVNNIDDLKVQAPPIGLELLMSVSLSLVRNLRMENENLRLVYQALIEEIENR